MPSPSSTVAANFPITRKRVGPVVIIVGVTSPKTPMGAKPMMNLVMAKIAELKLSQNLFCVSLWLSGSFEIKKPNRRLKKIKPSS